MIAPARQAALRVLQQVDRGATLADALVRERDGLADPRDRALVTELSTGTLRWLARLDAAIAVRSSRPLDTVDRDVRHILRLAAYQLLYLDRVPARAVVDDAVEQARATVGAKATGFVNGVLRALSRAGKAPRTAAKTDAGNARVNAPKSALGSDPAGADPNGSFDIAALAEEVSHPAWLLERWIARHGVEAATRWARFNNEAPDLTLRANRLRTTRDELVAALVEEQVAATPTRYARDGVRILSGQPIGGRAAQAGLFVVQDEASQLVGELAAAFAGSRMLDTCAAPGGKTLALAAACPETGLGSISSLVVAADRRPKRLRLLRDTLARAGASDTRLVQIDLRRALPFGPIFDLVLVDAPCSGLGTVRREPDIKWRRTESELASLADAQGRMLDVAARAVRPGGHLIYATCSSEPEENEEVVDAFLRRHDGFRPVHPLRPGPDREAAGSGLAAVIDESGRLRTWPHLHGLEAFFAAVLRRSA